MSQNWMIEVLEDLQKFASQNGLTNLEEHLADTIHVAVAEKTAKARRGAATELNARPNGSVSGTRGAM